MNLKIDNMDGHGPRDYSGAIDSVKAPVLVRKLNASSELQFSLIADGPEFVVPVRGARVTLGRSNGADVFTGYLTNAPVFEYLGYGERGPIYRYNLVAESDEAAMDRKRLPDRSPFVARSAGDALRLLTNDARPDLDVSGVDDLEVIANYSSNPAKKWSEQAAEIALRTRACYRIENGAVALHPVGTTVHVLDEEDPNFCPDGLILSSPDRLINDVTLIGQQEPNAYVKDYFCGDGLSLRFYLSQVPFLRSSKTIVDEEYKGNYLSSTRWSAADPARVISVTGGKLQIAGGTGADGQTTVCCAEKLELGGACVLQHGNFVFNGASDGIIGGLYSNTVNRAQCLAGFRVTPSGTQSKIQAWMNGASVGPPVATSSGHQYVLTTRFYSTQIFRQREIFHSSVHTCGNGHGGDQIPADVRFVLSLHDIDPNDPASIVAPATVLYDGVILATPAFCTYALLNAANMSSTIAFTRLLKSVDAEVRSALPEMDYTTRLVGSLSEGDECLLTSDPALQFFPSYVPAPAETIEVKYRGSGTALARVVDSNSVAANAYGSDDGTRGMVLDLKAPVGRTAADCENAALALMDDSTQTAWSGVYKVWSDLLPGGLDVFPGDNITVNAPSRGAAFVGTVRSVEIAIRDAEGEHSEYAIHFANDAAQTLSMELEPGRITSLANLTVISVDSVGSTFLADLTAAEITATSSTTVTVDAGLTPQPGYGIEVRRSDMGWSRDNDRNLIGRFTTRTFMLPRLSRVQDYYLRLYDSSSPAKYSRYSAALHLDFPL